MNMKHVGLEYTDTLKIGHHNSYVVVRVDCLPNKKELNIYSIKIVIKSKKHNRKKIHHGELEILDKSQALTIVKEYMDCGNILENMKIALADKLLKEFPLFYPPIISID